MLTDSSQPTSFLLDPSLLQMYARSMGMLGQMAASNVAKTNGTSSFRISDILSSPEEASGSNSESEARASSEECRSSPLRGSPSIHDDSLRGSSPSDESPGGKKARKARTIFTDKQLQELENTFDKQKYLSVQDRMDLAQRMGLSDTQVKTWYQNRRTKWKRQSSTGMELLADPSNLAAVQQLLQTNPYWANYMVPNQLQYPMGLAVPGNPFAPFTTMPSVSMQSFVPQFDKVTPQVESLTSSDEIN